jgi:hypothetical protein
MIKMISCGLYYLWIFHNILQYSISVIGIRRKQLFPLSILLLQDNKFKNELHFFSNEQQFKKEGSNWLVGSQHGLTLV